MGSAVALLIVGLYPWGTVLQVSGEDGLGSSVNPVARLGVFLRLQITNGSSASHFLPNFFSRLYILGLRPCRIMPLARSTWPFVLGCPTVDQTTRMWWSSQNVRNL